MNNDNYCGGYGSFAEFYDCLMYDVDYSSVAEYYNSLINEYSTPNCTQNNAGGILLDLACGTGKLSVLMAKYGRDVIGVDISPDMLANAESHEKVSYICQNMTELDLFGTIDGAICAFDSLNHLPDETALFKALERVSLFMNPGGVFVFDLNTLYKHKTILGNNIFVKESEKTYCVWQNFYQGDGVVDIVLDIFAENENGDYERFTEEIREKAYNLETVRVLCEKAGFEVNGCYDFMTRNQVNVNITENKKNKEERVVFVCRKVVPTRVV